MTTLRPRKLLSLANLAARSPASILHARRAIRRFGAIQRTLELARALQILGRVRPRVILEIGSHQGGTLYAWSRIAAADALIVTVDIPFDRARPLRRPERLIRTGQRIAHVSGDSHVETTLAAVRETLDGASADFLFIDGDHTLGGVTKDLIMYGPLVREGGIIGFHDVIRNPAIAEHEVWKLWTQLRALPGAIEIADADADRDGGMGIGLISMTEQVRNERAWQRH